MTNPWMQTYSGQAVDLLSPDPATILLCDIAWSLSRIPRFNGHTKGKRPYTVAQHCIECSYLCEFPLASLLHDAHEAYIGDIIQPVLWAFRLDGFSVDYIKCGLGRAIACKFGIDNVSLFTSSEVKYADLTMLATEKRDLMKTSPLPWVELPPPRMRPITYIMRSKEARRAFTNRAIDLLGFDPDA